jgi:hypothetical protein
MPLTKIQSLGITDGTIVNADINASAAIAGTKLSGAGKVLQVSNLVEINTDQTLATATHTDLTSMSLSITPSSASNKILLVSNIQCKLDSGDGFGLSYVRNSTTIAYSGANSGENYSALYDGSSFILVTLPFIYIDSPSTTSAITYKIQASSYSSRSINFADGGKQTFYAMEIAG